MAVYKVESAGIMDGEKPRIVEARTARSAIAHVARTSLHATVITTREAMALAAEGIELETAGDDAE